MSVLLARVAGKYRRTASRLMFRRMVRLRNRRPIVSFTFDDFPKSALHVGGEILRAHDMRGTYYAALGLMNQVTPTGLIFSPEDLPVLLERGHELGCHTFAHCDSWETAPRDFARSVEENRVALERLRPGAAFPTLSYPITCPRPHTKRRVGRRFECCRFGGQTINRGELDLNLVSAHFLEKDRGAVAVVAAGIEDLMRAGGWLVLATHDIADDHTPYGCTPAYFEAVVREVSKAGAVVLPMAEALRHVTGGE